MTDQREGPRLQQVGTGIRQSTHYVCDGCRYYWGETHWDNRPDDPAECIKAGRELPGSRWDRTPEWCPCAPSEGEP